MARLPVYDPNTTITDGSGTFRLQGQGAARSIESGLNNLGSGIGQLAVARERMADKSKALDEQDGLLDYEDRVQKNYTEGVTNMPKGGGNWAEDFRTWSHQEAEKLIKERYKDRSPEEQMSIRLRMRQKADRYIDGAARAQHKALLGFESEVMGKTVASGSAAILHDPGNYDLQAEQLDDFLAKMPIPENRKQAMRNDALATYQKSRALALAQKDPEKYIMAVGEALKDIPKGAANPVANVSARAAKSAGLDDVMKGGTKWFLAAQHIESRFNNNIRPGIDPATGKPISSARGAWQVIKSAQKMLGIKNVYDMEEVAPKVAQHFKENIEHIKRLGQPVTPGRMYLMWNMGQGMATAMMQNPGMSMRDLAYKVWASKGPRFIQKVFQGNPGLYKPGWTAYQAIQRSEQLMQARGREVDKIMEGGSIQADDAARSAVASLSGDQDASKWGQLTAADANEVYTEALKASKARTQKLTALEDGARIWESDEVNPYDSKTQKSLDAHAAAQPELRNKLLTGDVGTWAGALGYADRKKYLPKPYADTMREILTSGGNANGPAKQQAYIAGANLLDNHKVAFTSAKFSEDTQKKIEKYSVLTGPQFGMTPTEAIKRIDYMNSPEGQKQIEMVTKDPAIKKKFLGKLSYSDLSTKLDKSWFTSPTVTPMQRAAITASYKEMAGTYLSMTGDEEMAKAMALKNLERTHGLTSVMGGPSNRVVPYPIEKHYPAVRDSWDYAKKQALNFARVHSGREDLTYDNIMILPDAQTTAEIRAGKNPTYTIKYRDKNGIPHDLPPDERFTPKPEDVRTSDEAEFTKDFDQNKKVNQMNKERREEQRSFFRGQNQAAFNARPGTSGFSSTEDSTDSVSRRSIPKGQPRSGPFSQVDEIGQFLRKSNTIKGN